MNIGADIAIFFVGAFAAWFGAMVGGGGLVSIPFLIFMGVPPQVAIATNKFGGFGLLLGALSRYVKSDKIQWKYVPAFSIMAIFSSYLGAQLLLNIDRKILEVLISIIILALLPLLFYKKEIGTINREHSKFKNFIGYCLNFLTQTWGAFFGAAGATLTAYVYMIFFGFTTIESAATMKIPGIFITLIPLIMFTMNGIVNIEYGIALFLGMLVGGWLGAHTALKKGAEWVKILFGLVVLISAAVLIFK